MYYISLHLILFPVNRKTRFSYYYTKPGTKFKYSGNTTYSFILYNFGDTVVMLGLEGPSDSNVEDISPETKSIKAFRNSGKRFIFMSYYTEDIVLVLCGIYYILSFVTFAFL
jgi:hypothetical protein